MLQFSIVIILYSNYSVSLTFRQLTFSRLSFPPPIQLFPPLGELPWGEILSDPGIITGADPFRIPVGSKIFMPLVSKIFRGIWLRNGYGLEFSYLCYLQKQGRQRSNFHCNFLICFAFRSHCTVGSLTHPHLYHHWIQMTCDFYCHQMGLHHHWWSYLQFH